MTPGIHINLDQAWNPLQLPMPTLDALHWGPRLRYTAPHAQLERAFTELYPQLHNHPFTLFGSGDFHHLAAWFLRGLLARENPTQQITLICFDTHPDWDIRPPQWACGGWINRALEIPQVAKAAIWGCGNFELALPARLYRNRRALDLGRLEIHAWAERQSPRVARMFNCMTSQNWRDRFTRFARSLTGALCYISIDLDSLGTPDALTNWEHGLFTAGDLVWALEELHAHTQILGGDLCGAYSPPAYARPLQRLIANFDHPQLPPRNITETQPLNHRTLTQLWPALTAS